MSDPVLHFNLAVLDLQQAFRGNDDCGTVALDKKSADVSPLAIL